MQAIEDEEEINRLKDEGGNIQNELREERETQLEYQWQMENGNKNIYT